VTGIVKSVLHDATPSWNGYNYQGKVGLYVCLANILKEAQTGVDVPTFDVFLNEHHLEYEWIEDFAIKKNDIYLSLHQVKHKAGNNFNDHVEAISTILYRKNSVLSDTDIFKYFDFKGLKKGYPARIKTVIKNRIVINKLVDNNGLLNSNWKVNILSVDIKYRNNIFRCLSDFELLSQKAFRSSITYFHTADKVNSPSEDISKTHGIPSHLVVGLTQPKSLSCQQIFLSYDNPTAYNLALSDDALNTVLECIIDVLLKLFHPDISSYSPQEVRLYKTALCALIDENLVTRHQHIRDKSGNHLQYLQRTKPSIKFKAIVSELKGNYRVQNASYWNLICRENFELAYTEQIEDIYFLLVNSVIDSKTYHKYTARLESVRLNVIQRYFPNDCVSFLRRIYPHVSPGKLEHQYYSEISEPKKIKSVFFNFIKKVEKPSGKLTLKCRNNIFEYQPSCINFNETDPESKFIEVERVKKGLADNQGSQSNIFTNVDYIVINSTDENDNILAGIEKITEVESYEQQNSDVKKSDKITHQKEVSFMDSRQALGEING
jgi:hypothetical protein